VTVVAKGDQWYHVKLANGTEGWLAESVVKPAP
jgi:SH3-like domain-containing protein